MQAELTDEIEEVERAKGDAERLRSKVSLRDDDDEESEDDDSESGGRRRGIPFEEFTVYV